MAVDESGKLPDIAVDAAVRTDTAMDFLVLWTWSEAAEEGFLVLAACGYGCGW
jgi:hypothetical protein